MPTIGHIGRYALKYQLGAGGLGTVFAAHDPLLSRLIAVKTLNVEIKEDEREASTRCFINEARAAGGLSHPHIVTVFDAGISDNRAYIAMELLKGRDLRQLRQEGWRATPAQAALIIRRVADALAFAHSKGVIHRDIKPANIFMVGRTQPRVLDFGIARITHQRDSGEAMNGAGSPYYMSPEQVRERAGRPAHRRVLARRRALRAAHRHQAVRRRLADDDHPAVLHHEPPLASKVDKTVPKALAEIAARAMAKDPEQRFRSARSFARDLRQWLDANPAGPEGERWARPCPRRHPGAAAPRALDRRRGAGDRRRRRRRGLVAGPHGGAGHDRRGRRAGDRSRPAEVRPLAAAGAPQCRRLPSRCRRPRPPRRRRRDRRRSRRRAAAPTTIPTGANNPAAQEALLLASIVPMPALSAARPPEPAKATRRLRSRRRRRASRGRGEPPSGGRAAGAAAPPRKPPRSARPGKPGSAKPRSASCAWRRRAGGRRHRHRPDRDQPLGQRRGRRPARAPPRR